MKLGILADVHEEVERLRADIDVCSRAGVDRYVVLGDVYDSGKRVDETVGLAPMHRPCARTSPRLQCQSICRDPASVRLTSEDVRQESMLRLDRRRSIVTLKTRTSLGAEALRTFGRTMLLLAVMLPVADAGEFRAAPAEARILAFLDRDADGLLSRAEIERFPAPMRAWVAENGVGVDDEGPVPVALFGPTLREMLEELREGRYSRGAAGRPAEATGTTRVPVVRTDEPAGDLDSQRTAAYVFGLMDRNGDGELDRSEWYRSQTVRPWFEDEGIKFFDRMSRSEFVSHMVELAAKVEQSDD